MSNDSINTSTTLPAGTSLPDVGTAQSSTTIGAGSPTNVKALPAGQSVSQLLAEAHALNDQTTLERLTGFIINRDPGEYADPTNHNHALFLAADIMRNFDIHTKVAQ